VFVSQIGDEAVWGCNPLRAFDWGGALNLACVDTRKERLLEFALVVIAIMQFIPGLIVWPQLKLN
jgi:hypothetical protein